MKALALLLIAAPAHAQIVEPILINPIPEPGTIALIALGLGLMILRRLKRR